MAQTLPQPAANPLSAFLQLPVQRQLGLLAGVAMVIAVTVSIAAWGLRPTYQVLLPGMAERDVVQAMNVLGRNGIPHRLHSATGALMVPASRTHEARLQLATEGLPRAEGVGFELLDEDTGIGTSRLAESTRYQRALEGELARSVMTLASVESARVHLALPRQSVFLRDRVRPGASVLINLRPGRELDETQIAGIVHMVASSVPELEAERVTVIDQRGRLLSQPSDGTNAHLPSRQLDYTRRVEEALRSRVEDILAPLVGDRGMRVQVTAEVDFTQVESTREIFDPESAVVRSEQLSEEEHAGQGPAGIPGALSNQPPAAGVVQTPGGAEAEPGAANGPAGVNRNRRSVRNYELDRTISHIRQAPASLSRLSVAVVVDHRETLGEAGTRVRVPRDAAEMEHLTALVREAVGFNETRGDRVNVVNASFREIEAPEAAEPLLLWQEPWVQELAKQALAGLAVLLVVLCVLRPALKALAAPPTGRRPQQVLAAPGAVAAVGMDPAEPVAAAKPAARTLEGDLEHARKLTREDPRLVAQVVRQWVNEDEK